MSAGSTDHSGVGEQKPKVDRSARYGASCQGCRKRKQRCDARTPTCGRCEKLKEPCVYEATRRYTSTALLPLLVQAYDLLQTIADDSITSDHDLSHQARQYLSEHPLPSSLDTKAVGEIKARPAQSHASGPSSGIREDSEVRSPGAEWTSSNGDESPTKEVEELLMHMSLAEDGQNGHFGMTSMFWQAPSESVVERLQRRVSRSHTKRPSTLAPDTSWKHGSDEEKWATDEVVVEEDDEAGILKANASLLSSWEQLAFHKLELESDPGTARTTTHLLKSYFAWEYGTHCFVYRPVFIRDMALGGPYFSTFLLNVICALAARYSLDPLGGDPPGSGGDIGTAYLLRAKALLSSEIDKPSNIPTIQGLLLLGQRECVFGNLSQAWMYTGMAFRAVRDLGGHLDCSRLPIFGFGTLSAEDREIRRRLFWSCYSWDKIISLALGRAPTFNAFQNVSPGVMVDDTEDNDLWEPYFDNNGIPEDMRDYPIQKSYTTLNFRHVIKLYEILLKIVMRLYTGRALHQDHGPFVERISRRLQGWYYHLPPQIKLDVAHLPEHCPPPHIFATNCLYRAAWILLYRIFLPQTSITRVTGSSTNILQASRMCTQMAEEMHKLFTLCQKSFKLRNINYTLLWAMYTAATINAIDFRSTESSIVTAATSRLGLSLHVLEVATAQTPRARRSIEIIKQQLRLPAIALPKRHHEAEDSGNVRAASPEEQELPSLPWTVPADLLPLTQSEIDSANPMFPYDFDAYGQQMDPGSVETQAMLDAWFPGQLSQSSGSMWSPPPLGQPLSMFPSDNPRDADMMRTMMGVSPSHSLGDWDSLFPADSSRSGTQEDRESVGRN